ncbi:hypothetical protein pdam_00001793 [Pocillopora damicornis]|uniref:Uncharacterized protein n=1 Tax=Pocillopora damicornis TaxID=46731 RepID=A0A3M6TNP8_POCDA|nr:hypothetical protein pdam_00001793 [Pocillopora damicornis]
MTTQISSRVKIAGINNLQCMQRRYHLIKSRYSETEAILLSRRINSTFPSINKISSKLLLEDVAFIKQNNLLAEEKEAEQRGYIRQLSVWHHCGAEKLEALTKRILTLLQDYSSSYNQLLDKPIMERKRVCKHTLLRAFQDFITKKIKAVRNGIEGHLTYSKTAVYINEEDCY